MEKKDAKKVDFKKIDMRSKTTFFSDDMAKALFIHQPTLSSKGFSGSPVLDVKHINTKKGSVRNSPFSKRFR